LCIFFHDSLARLNLFLDLANKLVWETSVCSMERTNFSFLRKALFFSNLVLHLRKHLLESFLTTSLWLSAESTVWFEKDIYFCIDSLLLSLGDLLLGFDAIGALLSKSLLLVGDTLLELSILELEALRSWVWCWSS
jgi:hypothetical protein